MTGVIQTHTVDGIEYAFIKRLAEYPLTYETRLFVSDDDQDNRLDVRLWFYDTVGGEARIYRVGGLQFRLKDDTACLVNYSLDKRLLVEKAKFLPSYVDTTIQSRVLSRWIDTLRNMGYTYLSRGDG